VQNPRYIEHTSTTSDHYYHVGQLTADSLLCCKMVNRCPRRFASAHHTSAYISDTLDAVGTRTTQSLSFAQSTFIHALPAKVILRCYIQYPNVFNFGHVMPLFWWVTALLPNVVSQTDPLLENNIDFVRFPLGVPRAMEKV